MSPHIMALRQNHRINLGFDQKNNQSALSIKMTIVFKLPCIQQNGYKINSPKQNFNVVSKD